MANSELDRFLEVAERAQKLWKSFCPGGYGRFTLFSRAAIMSAIRFSQFSVKKQTGNSMAIVYSDLPIKYSAEPSQLVFYPAGNTFFITIDSNRIGAELAPQLKEYAISGLILKHTGTVFLHGEKFRATRQRTGYLKLTPEEEQEAWWFCYIIRALSSGASAYRKRRQCREDASWRL